MNSRSISSILVLSLAACTSAFVISNPLHSKRISAPPLFSSSAAATDTSSSLQSSVDNLKKVLEREYVSFFDPMVQEFYSEHVSFDDPLTSLSGVKSYQNNVDMLAGRTLMGSLLFQDAGINLHSVTGGQVQADGSISNIITRWTLRVTAKVLPWKPTARFSGISVYEVQPSNTPEGVQVVHQTDYWDSINLQPGGAYQKVDKGSALADFLNQLKPGGFQAQSAAPELPYSLLRRGSDYEVRRYPSYSAVQLKYSRRDEGFETLGSFTSGLSCLSPALMTVDSTGSEKYMTWPLSFAAPGESTAPVPNDALEKSKQKRYANNLDVLTIPSQVVAVAEFSDASMEPVVRKADAELRQSLQRDGIVVPSSSDVRFAQYDAIFSMGKRRGEVWIELEDGGHPW
jgi:hypothetical protein